MKRGKWQDTVLTFLANLCASLPSFVVALGLLYLFCMRITCPTITTRSRRPLERAVRI